MICPYCRSENMAESLICASCSRDIAAPVTLIAERDELRRKRDELRNQLHRARNELETIRSARRKRF